MHTSYQQQIDSILYLHLTKTEMRCTGFYISAIPKNGAESECVFKRKKYVRGQYLTPEGTDLEPGYN